MIAGRFMSFLGFALSFLAFSAFGFTTRPSSRCHRRLSTHFKVVNDSNDRLESQSEDYKKVLGRLDDLQTSIQQSDSTQDLQLQTESLKQVEKDLGALTSRLISPVGLSMEDYTSTMRLFLSLPPSTRLALVEALEMEEQAAGDVTLIPEIASKLFEERVFLTPQRLMDAFQEVQIGKSKAKQDDKTTSSMEDQANNILSDLLEKSPEQIRVGANVKQFVSRATRKDGIAPTAKDLEILMGVLDSTTFKHRCKPEEIPGGYLVRGTNTKTSGRELIEALDARLPMEWNGTVSYMADIAQPDPSPESAFEIENVLVLFHKDFSPVTNEWLFRFTSASALVTTFLFAVGIYGSTDAVSSQLVDLASAGDFTAFDWFNGKLAEVLLPLAGILAAHEIGHQIVAKANKIETASIIPTFLPFWSTLPLTGSVTKLTSSPKSLTELFDFAFLGPLLGFITSFIFLGLGLETTQTIMNGGDATAVQFLPALPVSVLKLSTLGGTIVDNFFGGNGIVTLGSPKDAISLHPYAIAGFCGLLINAVSLLPLGATDGGRLSLALFGRQGHSVVGGAMWLALLISSFTLADPQGDLLVTAWVLYNVVESDQEIPSRNEVDKVNIFRSFLAFALWFLAVLTVIPMA
jgi:membrane-associated protease RseP (regulator of RpoE activity)